MGSSLKDITKHGAIAQISDMGGGKPSDEEMKKNYKKMEDNYIERQGGMPESSVPGAAQISYSSHGDYEIGDIAPTVRTDKRGRKYIRNPHGSSDYYFNERTGAYQAGGGKTIMIRPGEPVEKEDSGGSGGGGGSEQQGSGQGLLAGYDQSNVVYNNQGGLLNQGLTTDQIVGGLLPGQEEYIYQVNPNHQVAPNLGTYVLPDFKIS